METIVRAVRRGLPRVAGGPPWPVVEAPEPAPRAPAPATASSASLPDGAGSPSAIPLAPAATPAADAAAGSPAPARVTPVAPAAAAPAVAFARRGLPRIPGGEAWPAEGTPVPARWLRAAVPGVVGGTDGAARVSGATGEAVPAEPVTTDSSAASTLTGAHAGERPVAAAAAAQAFARRGLPRVPGGEAWPAESTPVPERWLRAVPGDASAASTTETAAAGPGAPAQASTGAPAPTTTSTTASGPGATSPSVAVRTPAPTAGASRPPAPTAGTPSSGAGASTSAKRPKPAAAPAPLRGRYTTAGWNGRGAAALVGLLAAAGILVLAARGLTTFQWVRDFLQRYPGEYHLPASAPVGLPAWVGWQHFLNVFLMVLIVRSGLQVRHQKKPPAFFTPRRGGKKVSLNLWLHQSLDVLWMLNGVVFVVLLLATGQWMRVIPTSWEVFPNALSAALQYATLEWPVENGWVNYNALQQLAYGLTIFVAAPLAALSGWRMSALWPSKAAGLTRVYKVEWARAVHFPVMLYFVAFVLVHVILVLSTGALRNLNHMYAAHDGTGWIGFLTFAGSLAVIAGAWFAARPMLLAPIASRFGSVSSR